MKIQLSVSSIAVGLAIGALTAGGITYAATSSGGTTINACQMKTTGALRILTTGSCKTTEVALSWNSQGPQGDPGVQGVPGQNGAQGIQGPQGDRGPATYANSIEGIARALSVPSQRIWAGKQIYVPGPVHLALQDVRAAFAASRFGSAFSGQAWVDVTVIPHADVNCETSAPSAMSTVSIVDGSSLVDLGNYDDGVCVRMASRPILVSGNYSDFSTAQASAQLVTLSPSDMAKAIQ